MKELYLEELKGLLGQYETSEEEINDILADYEEMIDEALDRGMSEKEIIDMIGTPKKVARNLSDSFSIRFNVGDEFKKYKKSSKDNRIVALMPFLSVIAFMILGFGFDLWHPGWMVFFSIPISAILVNAFDKRSSGLVSLSPFIAVVTYLILGFGFNLWHPGWLVFLIIPVFGILTGSKKMSFLSLLLSLSPFIAVTFFIIWTYLYGDAEYAWLVFLIIPLLGGFHYESPYKRVVFSIVLLAAAAAYVYFMSQTTYGFRSLLVFLVPLGAAVLFGDDPNISFRISKKDGPMWIVSILCVIVYVVLGVLFPETWAYMWLIFLLIPMFAIVKYGGEKNKLTALMPFIATISFFIIGFFLNGWAYAWIAYLLIPMIAIIENR